MGIRKQVNQKGQHNKSANALTKAGISGVLISECNGEVIVTMFGNKKDAFSALQNSMTNVPYLKAAAQFVTGPKVTLKEGTGETHPEYVEGAPVPTEPPTE